MKNKRSKETVDSSEPPKKKKKKSSKSNENGNSTVESNLYVEAENVVVETADNQKKPKKKKRDKSDDRDEISLDESCNEKKKKKKKKAKEVEEVTEIDTPVKKKKNKNKEEAIEVIESDPPSTTKKKKKKSKDNNNKVNTEDLNSEEVDDGDMIQRKKEKKKKNKSSEEVSTLIEINSDVIGEIHEKSKKKKKKHKKEKEQSEQEEWVERKVAVTDEIGISLSKAKNDKKTVECAKKMDVELKTDHSEDQGNFGQWASKGMFESDEKQNKFLRLLGGFKKGAASSEKKTFVNPKSPFASTQRAMDKDSARELNKGLENQFTNAFAQRDSIRQGFGLGFQQDPAANKKFHIDTSLSKSKKFDD